MNRGQWRLLVRYENFHEHEKKKDHTAPKLFFFFKQASGALGEQSLFSVVPMLPSRAGRGICGQGHPAVLHPWVRLVARWEDGTVRVTEPWALPPAQDIAQPPTFPV